MKKKKNNGNFDKKTFRETFAETAVFFNLFVTTHISQLGKHENQQRSNQRNFCTWDLRLTNCHVCNNCTSKRLFM